MRYGLLLFTCCDTLKTHFAAKELTINKQALLNFSTVLLFSVCQISSLRIKHLNTLLVKDMFGWVLIGEFTPMSKIHIFLLTCGVFFQLDCFEYK